MAPNWTYDTPPNWFPTAVKTSKGWEDPSTGEVLVAIRGLNIRGASSGAAKTNKVTFVDVTVTRGGNLRVSVKFNEKVNVTAGASIVVDSTGTTGTITAYAAAQSNVGTVVFDKQVDNTTALTVPDEAGTLSVAAQTISGTILDANSAVKATGTLTFVGQPSNGQTVTIGAKTYTFQTTLTNTNGNVKIGASAQESLDNLTHAMTLVPGGAGVQYATATTAHTTVDALSSVGLVLSLRAKTGGTAGNALALETNVTSATVSAATLLGGTAGLAAIKTIAAGLGTAAGTKVLLPGQITSVAFTAGSYTKGANITVNVVYDQEVDVPVGSSIVLSTTGDADPLTLYAAAQTNTLTAVFNKKADNTTQAIVPADAYATGTLTLAQNAAAGNTVVIGSRTYTFEDTAVTNVAGNVLIGASASDTLDNLIAAVNRAGGGDGHGTLYAELTTAHPDVTAAAGAGDTAVFTADTVGKAFGLAIATTDTLAGASAFGDATLTGGQNYTGTLSIAAQTLTGDIEDQATSTNADLTISATQGTSAGTRVIA